jgi:hypothetical protein
MTNAQDKLRQIQNHKLAIAELEQQIKDEEKAFRTEFPIEHFMNEKAKRCTDAAFDGAHGYYGADCYLGGLYYALKTVDRLDLWKKGKEYALVNIKPNERHVVERVFADIERY